MNPEKSEHHFTVHQLSSEVNDIKKAKKDLTHFNVLYDRYYVRIFQFVYQRVQNESQAADITSEIFIKAMENIGSYKFMGVPFASWLFRIARNTVYLEYKKNNKLRQVNFTSEDIQNLTNDIEVVTINKTELLVDAIKELNEKETELIEMKYFEKRSYFEISNILNMTENNAKVKTFRVVQKLKSILIPISK